MEKTVEAVYENGALHPLEPLLLNEHQRVTVVVSDIDHRLLVSPDEWAESAIEDVDLDVVRRALSTIRGSLSEAILDERRER